jgi:hypothetical protein
MEEMSEERKVVMSVLQRAPGPAYQKLHPPVHSDMATALGGGEFQAQTGMVG